MSFTPPLLMLPQTFLLWPVTYSSLLSASPLSFPTNSKRSRVSHGNVGKMAVCPPNPFFQPPGLDWIEFGIELNASTRL